MGRRGLEPLTPCPRSCKCATNCANGPVARYDPTSGSSHRAGRRGHRAEPCRGNSPTIRDRDRQREHHHHRTTASPLPDLERHLERIAEDGYTVLPNAIEPELLDEVDEALLNAGARPRDPSRLTTSSRDCTRSACTTCWSTVPTFEKIPVHPNVLPVVERVLDPGLLDLVAVVDRDRSRRDGPAHPRRRPAHPARQTARADHLQHHVGDDRLHRGERRHAARPGLATCATTPPTSLEHYETIAAEMPKGSVLVWAREPLARRRRQPRPTSVGSASP